MATIKVFQNHSYDDLTNEVNDFITLKEFISQSLFIYYKKDEDQPTYVLSVAYQELFSEAD